MTRKAVYGGSVDAEGAAKPLQHLFRAGHSTGLNVTQRAAGANMSVDVNVDSSSKAGGLHVTTSNVAHFGYMNAAENVAITTANPTNPRRDIIVSYIDLSLITTSTTNNENALKFMAVAGTPAASPSDPSDPTIQTAVGTGNPFNKLARVTVGAAASSIVNANITDLRVPMALAMPYLYGGASNTNGHLVPNLADGTVVVSTGTGNVSTTMLASNAVTTAKIADANVTPAKWTNPYKFRVSRNAAANTGNGAFAIVAFDTEQFDTNNNVASGTYTAPVSGFYQFNWVVTATLSAGANELFTSALFVNGARYSTGTLQNAMGENGSHGSDYVQLTAGDTVTIQAFNTTTRALSVGNIFNNYFSGHLDTIT